MPVRVEKPREIAALRHVHHERVAIDVVAGVLVIQPRHRAAFVRRALFLVVPIDDQAVAVGVERRNQNDHDVPEHVAGGGVARRGQRIEQLVGRLRRADFGCVYAAASGGDGLVRMRADGPRRPEACVDPPDADWPRGCVGVSDVVGRADDGGDGAVTLGGGTEVDDLDAVRLRRHG